MELRKKISAPFEKGDNTFYYRNDGLQAQSVLYVKDKQGNEKVLLDPNAFSDKGTVALSGVSVSDDGKVLAYGVSESGSDWQQWQFMDIASGKLLSDKLEWIKFSSAVWDHANEGVFYARYDAPAGGDKMADVNFNQKVTTISWAQIRARTSWFMKGHKTRTGALVSVSLKTATICCCPSPREQTAATASSISHSKIQKRKWSS